MESKSIKYKGISRIPSDNDSFDGEMEEVYNLINFNGELRPLIPPDTIGSVSGDLVFVHKNSGYEHLISLDGNTIKTYNYNNGTITEIGNITNIVGETFIKCEAVGNTLIILTDKEVKYALWKNRSYLYLGKEIPFPVINFSHQPVTFYSDGTSISKTFAVILSEFSSDITKIAKYTGYVSPGRNGRSSSAGRRSSDSEEGIVSSDFENTVKGRINSFIAKASEDGLLIYPFFIRYALRMYDGSLVRHSMPILILPTKFEAFQVGIVNPSSENKIGFNFENVSKLVYSHNAFNDLDNYGDLIQSVDIFMSEPIYTYLYDENFNGILRSVEVTGLAPDQVFGGIQKAKEDILDEISSTSNFYYIHSISLSDLKTATSNKEIKVENINSLLNRESMTDDYLSHDLVTAKNSFVYNNKLHLSEITRTSFRGFKLAGNTCSYNGGAEALIEIGDSPYIFYPGRCEKLILKRTQWVGDVINYRITFLDLKEHKFLNGFYYLDPNLNNITNNANPKPIDFLFSGQTKTQEFDKIYVSGHQNPFYFPVESRITLPVSNIIAMASNTEAISQGQFGQFPLFVFTDDGIWALEVNQEGKYMARQPVSREVAINRNILQMDNALAFITAKGITILNGSQTECISDIIKDNNTRASKLNLTSFINAVIPENERTEMQNIYQTADIEQFLKDANLAYEYINGTGRVYAINEGYKYAYVFDILSKTWSKVKSDYKRAVNNYPDAYVQSTDGTIKILSSLGQSQENIRVMFITRPIKLENVLFSLQWINHKGILNNTLNTIIYGSRDGINYQPIKSGTKRLLRLTGSPYRFFKIAVIASLNPKDVLSGVDISLEPRYTNRLR